MIIVISFISVFIGLHSDMIYLENFVQSRKKFIKFIESRKILSKFIEEMHFFTEYLDKLFIAIIDNY